jgi:predicted metal-dependent hydrolase
MKKYTVEYGSKIIEFTLIRKKVKRVNLVISPSMEVKISASNDVPLKYIKDFVIKKGRFILKNIRNYMKLNNIKVTPKKYINGESFRYLGKQYRLKVVKNEYNHVRYIKGYIYLFVSDLNDINLKEKIMEDWYLERLEIISNLLFSKTYELIKKYNIKKPTLIFRKMSMRWGSCHYDKNKIILNIDLIKSPKFCIEYVILHELVHFKYNNHNKHFYDLISSLMIDWEYRKNILDNEIIKYL